MYEIRTTDTFENWLKALKDRKVVLSMAKRLDRAMKGNLGDVEAVGDGVSEIRIISDRVTVFISRYKTEI